MSYVSQYVTYQHKESLTASFRTYLSSYGPKMNKAITSENEELVM